MLPSPSPTPDISASERKLVERLRAGDEAAFMELIDMYHASLLRLALMYVPTRVLAEDVVQETWIGVWRGIRQFEGRSSLKTWIFRILMNIAKTRAQRESRVIPFSSFGENEEGEPSVDPARFFAPDSPHLPNQWAQPPEAWGEDAEERLLSQEARAVIDRTIDALPVNQRIVIRLRDIEGWSADEVRNVLEISETNQRVLLHRARARVRNALEKYFAEG